VTLSTIHRVKGREWDEVVLFGMTAGLIPHRLAENTEAERRVFHVGLTRGRQRVLVLGDEDRPSPFLRELSTDVADDPVPRPRADPPKAEPRPRPGGAPRVEATEGRRITVLGGYDGVIEAVEADGARLTLDGGRSLFVRFGERIKTDGRPGMLVAPGPGGDVTAPAEELLRSWRLERSRADGVPAFVVLSDAHLQGIAQRMPTTPVELRSCPGIGPTKLERYGDEILALLTDSTDSTDDA
jgi:DNA helicase-2/ATP-dependent DNA helicase PcrA